MTLTVHATHDVRRTFGVSHGPITRPDPNRTEPNRTEPALLQLLLWSSSHHGVQLGNAWATATGGAPSPATSRDGMMPLRGIGVSAC